MVGEVDGLFGATMSCLVMAGGGGGCWVRNPPIEVCGLAWSSPTKSSSDWFMRDHPFLFFCLG